MSVFNVDHSASGAIYTPQVCRTAYPGASGDAAVQTTTNNCFSSIDLTDIDSGNHSGGGPWKHSSVQQRPEIHTQLLRVLLTAGIFVSMQLST